MDLCAGMADHGAGTAAVNTRLNITGVIDLSHHG